MLPAAVLVISDERLLIWPVLGIAAGLYWFYKGFRLLQRKRLILNTPTSKIRSASMGLVEISGLATGPYAVTSPMKRIECYYYKSMAWELKQRGKNSEWVKVAEESLHVPFYVEDNTDKVLVDPRGAEMDLHCDFQEQYHRSFLFEGPDMPVGVSEFLVRHGVDPNRRIKVEEYCIKPKNFLFVLGTLSQNPGLDVSVAPAWAKRCALGTADGASIEITEEPQVIRLSSPSLSAPAGEMTQQQKIAAALVKAGISSPGAWTAAGLSVPPVPAQVGTKPVAPAATARSSSGEAKSGSGTECFDLHPSVVLMKGTHDPTFFISWRSQREILASLGWKSTLMIWGGPAVTLASLYVLLAHFGWL
ncbi:MAG TPA: GIDE domain-containing protein [Terriglobales bacterium]|nr:GIDE domain-containing protein [Terriglobales bacterium]